MSQDNKDKISIGDAIRLKHELNQDIKYGSDFQYNAKQIEELKQITPEQQDELSDNLSFIAKNWWFIPNYLWVIGGILGVISFLFFDYRILKYTSLAFGMYCFAQIFFRSGFVDGYAEGFMGGHESAVDKILGLTHDDVADIAERSVEMELDERLIEKMDMYKGKEGPWYYVKDKNRVGPVSDDIITELINSGEITADTHVWKKGMQNWNKAKLTELNEHFLPELGSKDMANNERLHNIPPNNRNRAVSKIRIIGAVLCGTVVLLFSAAIIREPFLIFLRSIQNVAGQGQALRTIEDIINIGVFVPAYFLARLVYRSIILKSSSAGSGLQT